MVRVNSEKLRALLQIYFIFGSNNCWSEPTEVLKKAIDGGITIFQFREKGKNAFVGQEKVELAKKLLAICREHGIPFIVNDDIELALEIGADGVHIGQDDDPVAAVRQRIGDNKIVGVSAHSIEEVQTALEDGADYLGLGPIFPTATKEDAKEVQGTKLIEQLRKQGIDIPLVGIGGINADNAESVIRAGADGVAVITAISHSDDVTEAARKLKGTVQSVNH